MFVVSNFLIAIATILNYGLTIYMYIIIARAIISWVNPDPYNPIVRFLNSVTEPVLFRIRRRLPLFFGGMDFSPIIVILAIIFIQTFVVQSLFQMATRLGWPRMAGSLETVIKVKVLPRSSRTEIASKENDIYRVKMTDPPVEGRANKALIALLAEKLGVPKRDIEITAGKTSRMKTVRVRGMSEVAVTQALEAKS
jgi:YggT family protein